MSISASQRRNAKIDAIFASGIILKHEKHGDYSKERYEQAKEELMTLLTKYPKLLKEYGNALRT